VADKNFKVKSGLNIPITSAAILTTDASGNISSTAVLPITAGGTGQTSATNAINALLPVQNGGTVNYVIQSDGSNINWGKLYNQTIKNNGTTVNPRGIINIVGASFADDSGTDTTTLTLNPAIKTINEKNDNYILQSSDNNKIIEINSSSNLNITVPTNTVDSIPTGTTISIVNKGSGSITFVEQTSALPLTSYSSPNISGGIAYGNGIWVGIVSNAIPYTSTDGINWTARTTLNFTTSNVSFLNNKFFAYGVRIFSSNDGISWTDLTGSTGSDQFRSMKYENSKYIAVGDNGKVGQSSDGVSWSWSSGNGGLTTQDLSDVVYAGSNTWYACTIFSPYLIKSIDNGSTWTTVTGTNLTTNTRPTQLLWDGSIIIAATVDGDILTSSNGTTWTTRLATNNNVVSIVKYGSSYYAFLGESSSPYVIYLYTSSNGTTWTLNDTKTLSTSAGASPDVVAVSDSGKIIWTTSTQNVLWTTGTESVLIKSLDNSKSVSKRYAKVDLYKYDSNGWTLTGDLDSKTVDVELNSEQYYNLMGVF
jgi:hypothetical protein